MTFPKWLKCLKRKSIGRIAVKSVTDTSGSAGMICNNLVEHLNVHFVRKVDFWVSSPTCPKASVFDELGIKHKKCTYSYKVDIDLMSNILCAFSPTTARQLYCTLASEQVSERRHALRCVCLCLNSGQPLMFPLQLQSAFNIIACKYPKWEVTSMDLSQVDKWE